MKQTLKWTGLVLVAAAVGLALVFAFAAGTRAQTPVAVAPRAVAQATPYPFDYGSQSSGQDGYDSWGMMGPGPALSGAEGMMGGRYRADTGDYSNNGTPLTLDQAIQAANQYLAAYGNTDLTLTEVMEFSDNFYAEVEEENSGIHAFELLIDRYSGAVYPEPGPNMMWNTKYGHMGGMMGQGSWQAGPTSVTAEKALELAQEWLDQYLPGTSAAEKADAFYGYYTIHTLKDGQVTGMLSVNDYTGEAWYHTWHGDFITMKELED